MDFGMQVLAFEVNPCELIIFMRFAVLGEPYALNSKVAHRKVIHVGRHLLEQHVCLLASVESFDEVQGSWPCIF
jgi:hypothetical protein